MEKSLYPFLLVNPKSYLYGDESLALAKATDVIAEKYGLTMFFSCLLRISVILRSIRNTLLLRLSIWNP